MPIPAPILDDRSYQQLRDELIRRIPVYTPEWTDHNPSDPGITLIELFAFLGENLLFRFNQIPEKTKLEYLRLLQIPLRPAASARALLTMTTEQPAGVLVPLYSEAKAGDVAFETLNEAMVWPLAVVAAGRIQAAPPEGDEQEVQEFVLRTLDALGGLSEAQEPAYYSTVTVSPDDSEPPVDFGASVDGMLWIAMMRETRTDPDALGDALVNLGFVPDLVVPPMEEMDACPGAGAAASGPAVEWQVSTGRFGGGGQPLYRAVAIEGDTTRGLTQEGIVRLRLPRNASDFGVFPLQDPDMGGTGDLPPVLDDDTEAKVLFWLRAFRHDGSRFGKVRHVGVNAAEVRQSRRALPEFIGMGTAEESQTYKLAHRPVIEGSLVLEVEQAGGWKRWNEVDGFHASEADAPHYILDREAGTVRFGNGLQGLPPQIGQRIRSVEYRYGGGVQGSVAAGAINKLPSVPSVRAGNPLAAVGGAEAESIEQALERIPGELRRRDRAVTADDFRELARITPGAQVGRAECLPRFHPPTKTGERPGIVSVVVWPAEDRANPNAPRPDRNLLRSVCAWLDARRLVTTELYVIPPAYRKVAVAVGLQVKDGYGVEAVRRWVELVIRQYLAPLPPYGPSGNGWPLGRRVHGPEVEAAALQVEGVEFLEDLKVAGFDEAAQQWVQGTVELALYEVPELTEITVVEGPVTLNPGEAIGAPPPGKTPVPIPVIRQVC